MIMTRETCMNVLDHTLRPVTLAMLCICAKLHIPAKAERGQPPELRSGRVDLGRAKRKRKKI